MKKLILAAAIILGSLSIHATTTEAETVKIAINVQDTYKEVAIDTVPAVVKTALEAAYPGAKLVKAYTNEKKEFKLEISVGDQKATVYSDVNGNWLKI